jgi:PTH2 family peptidyl-tRNA hydrolase
VKQVIVLRKDLRVGIGKLISQACHACLEASENAKKRDLVTWNVWQREGAKKVVVRVDSLNELLALNYEVKKLDIPNALIVDRGLTQIPANTPTALGIGPAKEEVIDKITGDLRLL